MVRAPVADTVGWALGTTQVAGCTQGTSIFFSSIPELWYLFCAVSNSDPWQAFPGGWPVHAFMCGYGLRLGPAKAKRTLRRNGMNENRVDMTARWWLGSRCLRTFPPLLGKFPGSVRMDQVLNCSVSENLPHLASDWRSTGQPSLKASSGGGSRKTWLPSFPMES